MPTSTSTSTSVDDVLSFDDELELELSFDVELSFELEASLDESLEACPMPSLFDMLSARFEFSFEFAFSSWFLLRFPFPLRFPLRFAFSALSSASGSRPMFTSPTSKMKLLLRSAMDLDFLKNTETGIASHFQGDQGFGVVGFSRPPEKVQVGRVVLVNTSMLPVIRLDFGDAAVVRRATACDSHLRIFRTRLHEIEADTN